MNNFTYMTDKNFSNGRDYIGASDMSTLAGVNSFQTPLEFWEIRTGRKEGFKGNKRTDAGHLMEPTILGEYLRQKYLSEISNPEDSEEVKKIEEKNAARFVSDFLVSRHWGENNFENYHSWAEFRPKENNRFVCHPDLLDLSDPEIPVLIQAKNTGLFAADQRKKNPFKGYAREDLSQNGVPIGVYLQEQWEMYCAGIKKAYVAVMIEGWDWRLYGPIHYNKKDVEKLVVLAEKMLWHIDNDVPPSPKTWPDVLSLFPNLEKNTKTVLNPEEELDAKKMISQHSKFKEGIRILNDRCLDIEMALAMLASEPKGGIMKNYLTSSTGDKLATFSEWPGRKTASLKELEKHPELYRQCEELGVISESLPTRRILINGTCYGTVELYTALTFDDDNKIKRSRKKYNKKEKDELTAFAKSTGFRLEWEKYNN